MIRNVVALLAMAVALAASGALASGTLHETSGRIVADRVASGHASAQSSDPAEANNELGARATVNDARAKPDGAAMPNSSGFILLGLCVVLVGVIARRGRRFRRSGTILLR